MKKFFNLKKIEWGLWILIAFFGLVYSFVAIIKHLHFQTGLDLAIYVQSFWSYSHLALPRVTLYPTFGDLVYADHFTPSLVLLAPIYFLFPDAKTLLVLQSFLFCLGAYPIFHFAKEISKSKFFAYCLILAYFLFFGTQFALTFDFHSAAYSAIFLPWLFWFLFKKQWKTFIIFALLTMGAKEDMPLLMAAVGAYLVFSKTNFKVGGILILISLAYFVVVTKFLMPSFSILSAKTYNTPELPHNISGWLTMLFDSPVKVRTIFLSMLSFAFLPLISGWFAIIWLAHFVVNFVSAQFSGRWDIFLHYRVHLGAILCFSSVLAAKRISALKHLNRYKKIIPKILGVAIVLLIIFLDYYLHLSLNTVFKPQFYKSENWMENNFAVMKKIPPDAYLLTQNNLAPHVANRKNIFYYPKNLDKSDYLFLDLRPNQLIINFWASENSEAEVIKNIHHLLVDGSFKIYYQKGDAILLKRVRAGE